MKNLVLFFFALLLVSCNDTTSKKEPSPPSLEDKIWNDIVNDVINGNIVYPYQYKAEDSVYIDLELYEVKEELYTLLDSLIEIKDLCPPKYLYKDEFIFSSRLKDGKTSIYISYLCTTNFDYNDCSGFFMYKNYRFNYVGTFLECYFKKTNEMHKFRCVSSEAILIDIDDSALFWEYYYDNGKLNIFRYKNCDGYGGIG